jgi:hypothetical protein
LRIAGLTHSPARDGDVDGARGAYLTETNLPWQRLIRIPEAPLQGEGKS